MQTNQEINDTQIYPINETVKYNDDKEYRACIRRIFCMVCKSIIPEKTAKDWDETTLDEYDHDQETMAKFLDRIYENTIQIDILQDLYKVAAGFMLSEDPSIGLAILFSYDYFELFHCVLCDFFKNNKIDQEAVSVVNLKKKMTR